MLWHLLGLTVACIWGSTFVASKVLLNAGLSPAEIMCMRFALAWVLMLPWCFRHILTNWRDELCFVALGLTGGSLYFLSENTAVQLTSATSTVALLVCTTPIVTALMNRMVHRKEHLSNRFLSGTMVALVGVSLVVFNGVFVLDDDPWVIILSVSAAVMWGLYCLVIRRMDGRYSSAVITRKVFFWGVITMLPVCLWEMWQGKSQLCNLGSTPADIIGWSLLTQGQVWMTVLFLAMVASLACFLAWNIVLKRIGIITAGNYLYFNPVTSLIAAYLVLDERITWLAIVGCMLTIAGVYLCNTRRRISFKKK